MDSAFLCGICVRKSGAKTACDYTRSGAKGSVVARSSGLGDGGMLVTDRLEIPPAPFRMARSPLVACFRKEQVRVHAFAVEIGVGYAH